MTVERTQNTRTGAGANCVGVPTLNTSVNATKTMSNLRWCQYTPNGNVTQTYGGQLTQTVLANRYVGGLPVTVATQNLKQLDVR
jgi:hypothetical protein